MSKVIRNGKAYPTSFKNTVIKAMKGTKTNSQLSKDFNISIATVSVWKRKAGLSQSTPSGLARHIAHKAAAKTFNTPTVQPDGSILYQGRTYR